MKRILLNSLFRMAMILVVLTAFQCSDDKPNPNLTCSVTGTLKSNICGVGVWGSYVIVLENGTVLQPYDATNIISTTTFRQFVPQQGMKITFGYEEMARDTRYDNVAICQAVPIYSNTKTKPIRFTCFQ